MAPIHPLQTNCGALPKSVTIPQVMAELHQEGGFSWIERVRQEMRTCGMVRHPLSYFGMPWITYGDRSKFGKDIEKADRTPFAGGIVSSFRPLVEEWPAKHVKASVLTLDPLRGIIIL